MRCYGPPVSGPSGRSSVPPRAIGLGYVKRDITEDLRGLFSIRSKRATDQVLPRLGELLRAIDGHTVRATLKARTERATRVGRLDLPASRQISTGASLRRTVQLGPAPIPVIHVAPLA